MRNDYDIARFEGIEPNLIEVRGTAFCIEDLFEFVGREDFVCEFVFRANGEASQAFAPRITAVIRYSPAERAALLRGSVDSLAESGKVRLNCLMPTLAQPQLDELKYGGVSISEIQAIAFIPFRPEAKVNDDGTKEVPGIVRVEMPRSEGLSVDTLFMNLAIMRNNEGDGLIQHEKERLIGTILGIREGRIDSRILEHFGFDVQQASANREISYHTLRTRQRRGTLSSSEQERLSDLCALRRLERATLLLKEIARSGITAASVGESQSALTAIVESIEGFEPHVFVNGKTPVHWDLEGYLHIAMRHVKDLQIGKFKDKTPFPYRADDLKTLIDKVLGQIEGEIHAHYSKPPPIGAFRRNGRMAVYFNGDYYTVRIDPEGRLVTIHVCGERDKERPTRGSAQS
jgi:hypothetical protein